MTQSSTARPWLVPALASGTLLLVGALCVGLGLDRAEKVLSIVGSVAGVAGAAIGIVTLLRAPTALGSPPSGVPPGGIYSGGDTHIGPRVNTGGVLAVGGILATLYLVLGATGVVRSPAPGPTAEPGADLANLTGQWRNGDGTLGDSGSPQIFEQDAVLVVDRTGRFSLSIDGSMLNQHVKVKCAGDVNVDGPLYQFLSASSQWCGTFTGGLSKDGRYLGLDMGQGGGLTLARVRRQQP